MNNLLREKMYLVQQLMDWPCPEMWILHHTDLFVNDLTVCIIMSRTAKILIDSWSQCIIDIIDVHFGNLTTLFLQPTKKLKTLKSFW